MQRARIATSDCILARPSDLSSYRSKLVRSDDSICDTNYVWDLSYLEHHSDTSYQENYVNFSWTLSWLSQRRLWLHFCRGQFLRSLPAHNDLASLLCCYRCDSNQLCINDILQLRGLQIADSDDQQLLYHNEHKQLCEGAHDNDQLQERWTHLKQIVREKSESDRF